MLPRSIFKISSDNKLTNTVWFVQIIAEFNSSENVSDHYAHAISVGDKYMVGNFLEQLDEQITR